MATRMSSKTARPKTLNRGAADEREIIKDWAKRYALKYRGDLSVQIVLGDLLTFLATRTERNSKRKGGLGRQ